MNISMTKQLEIIKKNSSLIKNLYSFIKDQLKFTEDCSISFLINEKNAQNPLGATAFYSPDENKISVYIVDRHIKDILRSIAHELVHHYQKCNGKFDNSLPQTEGYAQEDEHLREMEKEAYLTGNMLFRDFEDNIKTKEN